MTLIPSFTMSAMEKEVGRENGNSFKGTKYISLLGSHKEYLERMVRLGVFLLSPMKFGDFFREL